MTNAIIHIILGRNEVHSDTAREIFLRRHKAELEWALGAFPSGKGVCSAAVAGAFAFAYPTNPEGIDQFAKRLVTGVGEFTANDPALRLKDSVTMLTRGHYHGRQISLKALRACMAYLLDEPVVKLMAAEEAVTYFAKAHAYTEEELVTANTVTETRNLLRQAMRE